MKGYEDLIARTKAVLLTSNNPDTDELTLLQLRVDLLERTVYYLLNRVRDEGQAERRSSNKLDIDLAVLQSGLRSSLESTDARTDIQRKSATS